jgi:hypothetical protein
MQLNKDYIDDFDATRKLRPFSVSPDGKFATCKVYWKSDKGDAFSYGGKVSGISVRMFDKSAGFILETTQLAKEIAIKPTDRPIKEDRKNNRSEQRFSQR